MIGNKIIFSIVLFKLCICVHADFLDSFNEDFRATYDSAWQHVISLVHPVIICHGDDAIIMYRGQRLEERVIPKLYHDLKAILIFLSKFISHSCLIEAIYPQIISLQ